MNDALKQLIINDEKVINVKTYKVLRKDKDNEHYERRKQQRAISEEMVSLCLAYGYKKRIREALTYTILDKSIKNTQYAKYLPELRGLRVVLDNITPEELGILTVYWVDEVKKR